MDGISITNWAILALIALLSLVSPLMGLVRGVRNGSVVHSLLSLLLPAYGLIYFFRARRG